MQKFDISHDPSFPYHPQANPVEAWMQPLGKCLKIAHRNRQDLRKAIRDLLIAYRSTPHSSTGLSPGEMFFRHGFRGAFPNKKMCSAKDFKLSLDKMIRQKSDRCLKANLSNRRQEQEYRVGQWVLIANNCRRKFDTFYSDKPWVIEKLLSNGVTLKYLENNRTKLRHFYDIKEFISPSPPCDFNFSFNDTITINDKE